ncbi:MAG TPA: pilus assembly protein PilZ [Elusimicrobia bacterium]|nr:MAG: hypothetical protein A2278_04365 [Elusimicrobia bacterium RIFOXYA12_FULL_49_49]OGS08379.1 MAG: hypothetical protein A2204_03505 [Elusimicrobia bacterium RIFOXYA1_FULL_47_7]OGS10493.1 MAG: hypothetical protein A2386_05305 [Elusimicrobia bacterium RIFOXYB1_FULL_48_9]OGS14716.1 MAG: hypothetical protein A2251_09475 [Elusimicrobia bacterium RIFOXYA2_FULL_47_53]OGS25632.1 MAG: hypothetical protein A2339_06115 [Elusimicrobia bacterium RIFOXYB12_FULL_50_12]OGS31807.1 MAG: hypothetical protein
MRTFIRHPSDIPLEIHFDPALQKSLNYIRNISSSGVCFSSSEPLKEGAVITVKIPVIKPPFETLAKVVWCRPDGNKYDVGVEFIGGDDMFKVKMVEQVCHIEHYRQEVLRKEGRAISGTEAAAEWISKFAENFLEEELKKIG